MSKKRKHSPARRPELDLTLVNFEVTNETKIRHSEAVLDILDQAAPLLKAQNGPEAERLFRQALELEPEQPDLLHNLAASLALQDRHAEALVIVNQLFQEHSDYLFARTALARHAMQADDLQQAADLLEPLFERRKFHFSEFDSLCATQIELLLRQGDLLSAQTWFEMWEGSNPKNPKLEQFRRFFPGR